MAQRASRGGRRAAARAARRRRCSAGRARRRRCAAAAAWWTAPSSTSSLVGQGQRAAPPVAAAVEVVGAVDGVDDPGAARWCRAVERPPPPRSRRRGARGEPLDDQPLGGRVGGGDDVGAVVFGSASRPSPGSARPAARPPAPARRRGRRRREARSSTTGTLPVASGVLWPDGAIQASDQGAPMSDKSPRQGMSKKSGKSIKEKRAEKHAKAAGKTGTPTRRPGPQEEVSLLSLGVIGTSAKENEHRLPLHPEHLARLDARDRGADHPRARVRRALRRQRRGPGRRTWPASRPARRSSRGSDVVVLPKPQHEDVAAMHAGQVLWGWPHCVQDPR